MHVPLYTDANARSGWERCHGKLCHEYKRHLHVAKTWHLADPRSVHTFLMLCRHFLQDPTSNVLTVYRLDMFSD